MASALETYKQLAARIDEFAQRVAEQFPGDLTCHAGCDACCRHLTLFPVEVAALLEDFRTWPVEELQDLARSAASAGSDQGPCPLLGNRLCRVYRARPLICRSHGLPLLVREGDGTRVDRCPLNFVERESLPGGAILDLEAVNTALVSINRLFLAEARPAWAEGRERLSLAETVLLAAARLHS